MDTMVKDKDKDKSGKGSSGREPNEMLDLLKTFYTPDEENEIQEFSSFYSRIEEKLETENPSNQIAQTSEELENQYLERQQRLEQFLRRMDETNFNPINKLKKKSKSKKAMLFISFIVITLAGMYFFKNYKIEKRTRLPRQDFALPRNDITESITSEVSSPAETKN